MIDKRPHGLMDADECSRIRWALASLTGVALYLLPGVLNGQDGSAEAETEAPSGFFEILFSGGIVGIIIMSTLIAVSLTATYLVFDQLMSIRRKDLMPTGLGENVRNALIAGDVASANRFCNENPSMLAFVLMHGISELEFGWQAVEKSLEDALAEQAARLFRKIEYLSLIANIAPMLGLLGTVTGMILAFQQVAETQGTASAPQLAEGIYSALVTTVAGLVIAIPSLGAFAILRNRIDQFIAEAAYNSQHVFTPLRRKAKRS
jgi:biopolymer transport protein ExbB